MPKLTFPGEGLRAQGLLWGGVRGRCGEAHFVFVILSKGFFFSSFFSRKPLAICKAFVADYCMRIFPFFFPPLFGF